MIDPHRVPHKQFKQWVLFAVLAMNVIPVRRFLGEALDRSEMRSLWSQQTEADLRELEHLMRIRYIYGVYAGHPGYPNYFSVLEDAQRRAHIEALAVESPLDYQYVIRHFLASFDDPHIWIDFVTSPTTYQWPGFLLVYRGHQYSVAGSEEQEGGSRIEGCDGGTDADLIQRVADISRGGAYDESEKAWYAVAAMAFTHTRYQSPPKVCRIGGRDVTLHWRDISTEELRARQAPLRPKYEDAFSIRPFAGEDGAWVRLPSFEVHGEQAAAFTRVIAEAPSLRDKKLIVIDLRANGGGPYQWFMGFLRSLYGEAFTNYHARERLKIQGVYLDTGQFNSNKEQNQKSVDTNDRAPADPVLEATEANFTSFAGRYGQRLQRSQRVPANFREEPTGPPPENPVHGAVVVLTDNGSASAVNSFLDEVKHFPNVTQIGTEPMPDRRSGSPMPYTLSSGNGTVYLPYMTRDYRSRNDNQEHVPAFSYAGDIRDNKAVMEWVQSLIPKLVPQEANTR